MNEGCAARNFFTRGPYGAKKAAKDLAPFECQICGRIYAGRSGLWRHLKRRKDHSDAEHKFDRADEDKSPAELAEDIIRLAKVLLAKTQAEKS